MAERLLMLPALNRCEIPREFEKHALLRHQFMRACLRAAAGFDIFEKIADLDAKRARDLIQPAGGDPVNAGLIFVGLLIGDADQFGHLLLGKAKHYPALTNTHADIAINVQSAASASDTGVGDFTHYLIHRFNSSKARSTGFPLNVNSKRDMTTQGKISAFKTFALEKNVEKID
jgi:hypothetical protein